MHSLVRTTVGETLRTHASTGHTLQPVISNCGRCVDRFFRVTGVEHVSLIGGVRPDPGKAAGLRFEAHRHLILIRAIVDSLAHLTLDSKNILYVMSDLMSENVRLREISGSSEALLQLVIEAEVDVHLLIFWTVERAGRRLSHAAAGRDAITKKDELRMRVTNVAVRKDLGPILLCVIEDERDELNLWFFCGIVDRARVCRCGRAPACSE